MFVVARLLTAALAACALAALVDAQQAQQPDISLSQPLVRLNVLVLDDSKHAVPDVTRDELRVLEDNVEQKISLFEREALPLSYGLVVDSSGSLKTQFRQVIEAARTFISSHRPEDEAFIMRFIS